MEPISILILLLLLVLSGFFSGSETALVSLSNVQLDQFKNKRSHAARAVIKLRENTKRMLITILVGNNIVNIAASSLATIVATAAFGNTGIGIAIGIMTFLILLFGEVIPKNFSAAFNVQMALFCARPLLLLQRILFPLIITIEWLNHIIFRIADIQEPDETVTKEDIQSIISMSSESGTLDKQSLHIMEEVLHFNNTRAEEIMTPENEVFALEGNLTLGHVKDELVKHQFSRIPIYSGEKTNYIGILHISEILKRLAQDKTHMKLKNFKLSPVFFIPETKLAGKLLKDFQNKRIHLAAVVDEHGQIQGIVSLEDVIEELVGDILDETDDEEVYLEQVKPKQYIVDGRATIDFLNKRLDLGIISDEVSTINGYVLKRYGRVPKKGDELKLDKKKITILSSSKTRVKKVSITL